MSDAMEVGTERLQDTIEERQREAAGDGDTGGEPRRSRWLDYLAISTALFAVLAAVAALQAGAYANEALYTANKAVLQQTRAVDAWSEFQANSLKKYEQRNLIVVLAHVGGSPKEIAAANAEATRRQQRQNELQVEAKKRDAETARLNAEAQRNLEHHHRFAVAVTLFQVAIGLAAIAALLRRPPLWYVSLVAGGVAALAFADGFTMTL